MGPCGENSRIGSLGLLTDFLGRNHDAAEALRFCGGARGSGTFFGVNLDCGARRHGRKMSQTPGVVACHTAVIYFAAVRALVALPLLGKLLRTSSYSSAVML